MKNGCGNPSKSFTNYSFAQLHNAGILPQNLTIEDFPPCTYLPQLQQVLFTTDSLNDDVSYQNFVIVPESLEVALENYLGYGANIISGTYVSCSL
jgi:hypothetical protein